MRRTFSLFNGGRRAGGGGGEIMAGNTFLWRECPPLTDPPHSLVSIATTMRVILGPTVPVWKSGTCVRMTRGCAQVGRGSSKGGNIVADGGVRRDACVPAPVSSTLAPISALLLPSMDPVINFWKGSYRGHSPSGQGRPRQQVMVCVVAHIPGQAERNHLLSQDPIPVSSRVFLAGFFSSSEMSSIS